MKSKKYLLSGVFSLVVFAAGAQNISTKVGTGAAAYLGDGGQATAASIHGPAGLLTDGTNNLYIADQYNNCIRKVDPLGVISTFAGNDTAGFSGDGGPATAARFNQPTAIARDKNGNYYIADKDNNRIRKITAAGIVSTIAGNGAAGFSGDNDTAIYAKLNHPTGVAVDSAGNVFIADQMNNRIRMVSSAGIITTVVGNGVATFNSDLQPFPSMVAINKPYSVAVSPSNEVYFADTYNNIIRKYDRANNKVVTVKGRNALLLSLGEGTLSLNKPTCITFDNFGNMYIADEGNLLVKKLDSARIYKTVAGSGTFGFSGDGGAALSAKFSAARGLAADGAGNVFISDFHNERVRYYNAPVNVKATVSTSGAISVYPNPANNGTFTVNVNLQQPARMVLNITDIAGRIVFSKQTETNSPVDVQLKQPSGIYILQVITDDNFWTSKIEISN